MARPRTRVHAPLGTILMAIGCVVVILVVAAVFYWIPRSSSAASVPGGGPPSSGSWVEIQSYELTTNYETTNTSDTSYLAPPDCSSSVCPIYVVPGENTTIIMTLEDNDSISHQVLSVTFNAPFSVVATTPTLPVTLAPNVPTVFDVEVQVPSEPAAYIASGTITTK